MIRLLTLALSLLVLWSCSQTYPTAPQNPIFSVGRTPGWIGWDSIKVVAHRGYACCYPENTLEAVQEALLRGAGAIEVDVHFTRDGVPVLMHDETLHRTTTAWGLLRHRSLTELSGFNACPGQAAPCRIPTLQEVLQVMRGRSKAVLDLKDASDRGAVDRIFDVVDSLGMRADVAIISGRLQTLMWVRAISDVPIGFYLSPPSANGLPVSQVPFVLDHLAGLGRAELMLRADEVEQRGGWYETSRSRGVPIGVWTAHSVRQLRALLETPGVTRVLSDVVPEG